MPDLYWNETTMTYLNSNADIHFYIKSLETELLDFSQAHR